MIKIPETNLITTPFSRLDLAFAEFITQRCHLDHQQKTSFKILIARLSFEQSQGHSCLRINKKEQQLILASVLPYQ